MNLGELSDFLIEKSKSKRFLFLIGNGAVGKSTLANKIAQNSDCNVLPTDEFFVDRQLRYGEGRNLTACNILSYHMPALKTTLFSLKNKMNCFYKPRRQDDFVLLHGNKFTVVEGVATAFLEKDDAFVVYLKQDEEVELKRRIERDLKKGKPLEFIVENVKIMRKEFENDIEPLLADADLVISVDENFDFKIL